MKWCRVIALLLVGTAKLSAHSYYNLDFETLLRDHLYAWPTGAWNGYELTFDDGTASSGRLSYRIRSLTAPDSGLAPASIALPVDQFRGKQAKISGFIKTQTVLAPATPPFGSASKARKGSSRSKTCPPRQVNGTTDWTRYEYELAIDPAALQVYLGLFLTGRGIALVRQSVGRSRRPSAPTSPAPYVDAPHTRTKSVARRQRHSPPYRPARPRQVDLEPLAALIGNARVVALGEATHGTAEFFRMKHRIIEFLASHLGFTIFAIEANMPEAYALNAYIINGEGDPAKLLQGLYFWTWNTQEVLDMIEWMRDFNRTGRGRIQFTGFDMQTCTVAARVVQILSPLPAPRSTRKSSSPMPTSAAPSAFLALLKPPFSPLPPPSKTSASDWRQTPRNSSKSARPSKSSGPFRTPESSNKPPTSASAESPTGTR